MASIQFTEADRDERGFVKAPEPRSLADLLPTPQAIQLDATTRIQRQPPTKAEWAAMIALGILLVALLGYLWSSGEARPASPPRAMATLPATSQPSGDGARVPSPLPAATPATTGRLLIAFAAPDGVLLGVIESTRVMTPTAHYGEGWIQADVAGSGLVWLRAADFPALAIVGPDLAPRRAAPQAPAATPPPPPPPCAEAGVPGKMVEVCDYAELSVLQEQAKQQWIETYGGNVGVISTPSPQIRSDP